MSLFKYDGSAAAQTLAPAADFFGSNAAETITGTAGRDSLWLGQGDKGAGGAGDDTYYLQGHNTTIVEAAGGGVDRIVAWSSVKLADHPHIENLTVGNDGIYGAGNALDNIIEGQGGSQQIYGGFGQDILIGGAGADVFVVVKGEGNDVIQDFNVGEDKLRLKAGLSSFEQVKARMSQDGADVKLDLGGGDGLVFRGVTVGQFTAANFQLELDASTLGAKTFGDEFSGPLSLWDAQSNPTGLWRPDFGYQGEQGTGSYTLISNDEKQIYTSPYFRGHDGDFAESPFVNNADGTLSIWAKPSTNGEIFGYGYTSGMITTKETFSQTYGYFEMRADIPSAAGAWPAFWLIPADGSWPPELDVMETLTSDPNGLWTTQHSSLGGHSADGQLSYVPDTADGFHTYGAMWTPTEIVWYLDNVEVFRSATPADMNKPMFMIANLALGGWGGAIDGAALPAEFKIDYIRAYALGDGTGSQPPVEPPASTPPTSTPPTGEIPVPPASGDGVTLTSQAFGDVMTGGAGADTLTAGNGGELMTGGAGGDVFVFKTFPWSPTEIQDFQVGVDKLDLSALMDGYSGADPVADGRLWLFDDGAGGTKVCVDPDGFGGEWPLYVAHLMGVPAEGLTADALLGSGEAPAAEAPAPAAPGVELVSDRWGAELTGGDGADTLNAGYGPDVMTGGAGADRFVFDNLPWNASKVTDFEAGVDKLDVSGLLDAAGYTGSNPVADGYVKLIDNGQGDTWVYFDTDGAAAGDQWGTFVTTLEKVSAAEVKATDWII
ncbi:endo-1,3-1,4-beta-glycanase, C-terminal secretion signal protein [Phenylobacterium zucineum HLK1]|uniref:Endo-1,3-1,4-beta-glycanase, C-terminal secretion signal protein n=1 Tax=Phenylobacterium zucineum (strain HLK1) TaxID=450851 RepID=B4R935_PHEZH|nr:family 16 glycosylhydrolase [Phenylobacterium zucineum]ACG77705.1 endo-1,3-1,4-beta-glycanase, C-terminal secretion signal protein [Phenylobacterium zucineum HLK1]